MARVITETNVKRREIMLKAKVKNTPNDVKSGMFVVARRSKYTAELRFFQMVDDEQEAYNLALELEDGVVLESVDA